MHLGSHVPVETRLLAKVDKNGAGGCWLWHGTILWNGYGSMHVNKHPQQVHRVAWELVYGPIPTGMQVCHSCDVRNCVNPDHLFLGTQRDNIHDMQRKGRHVTYVKPGEMFWERGSQHPNARLTEEQVRQIHVKLKEGYNQFQIAAAFQVSRGLISDIKSGRKWKHIYDEVHTAQDPAR